MTWTNVDFLYLSDPDKHVSVGGILSYQLLGSPVIGEIIYNFWLDSNGICDVTAILVCLQTKMAVELQTNGGPVKCINSIFSKILATDIQ